MFWQVRVHACVYFLSLSHAEFTVVGCDMVAVLTQDMWACSRHREVAGARAAHPYVLDMAACHISWCVKPGYDYGA